MIHAEQKKLVSNQQILFMIVILFLLNTSLTFYRAAANNKDGYSARDVGIVYAEMSSDQEGYINEKLLEQNRIWEELVQKAKTTGIVGITEGELNALMGNIRLCEHIHSEIQKAAKYGDYLADIEAEAMRLRGASLLFQADSFSSRNILDLAEDYVGMDRTALCWSPSEGMELVTNSPLTDTCILLCIAIFVILLTASEREDGYHALIHAVQKGCNQTWFAKWCVLMTAAVVLMLLFYTPIFWLMEYLVGFGDFNQPVQSMTGYYGCPYELTIGKFIVVFFGLKVLAILCTATVFFCLGCYFSRNLWAAVSMGALILVSCIPMLYINRTAWYGMLKEFNLVAVLDTHHYLNNSINVNIAGYPVSAISIGIIFCVLSTGVAFLFSCFLWNCPTINDRKTICLNLHLGTKIKAKSLWRHEIRKLLITNQALSISLVMLAALIMGTSGPQGFNQTQYYYRQYAAMLSGALTEETQQILNDEAERIANAELQISLLAEKISKGEISAEAYSVLVQQWEFPQTQQVAFDMVQDQYAYLLELQSEGVAVEFLDESGWQQLTGAWGESMSLLNAVWMALLLTLCIHNYWSMESTSGMITLINCAARGMERTKWVKYKVILGFAILVAPLAFVNQIYLLHQSFPIDGWNSFHLNARSVYALREIPQWCSIAGYLALRILSIIAETILCAWGVLAISMRVRNSLVSLFLCAIVFGTAVVLATLMGYPPILSGRVQAYDAFMVMAVFLVTFVALCLNYSERKNFQRGKFEYT